MNDFEINLNLNAHNLIAHRAPLLSRMFCDFMNERLHYYRTLSDNISKLISV